MRCPHRQQPEPSMIHPSARAATTAGRTSRERGSAPRAAETREKIRPPPDGSHGQNAREGKTSVPPLLLVEDNASTREAVKMVLEAEGYPVVAAANGAEALRLLQTEGLRPSLILLDLMMPVMDGWAFRAAQLRDRKLAEIPVVVTSAHAEVGRMADDLGAAALPKPIDIQALRDVAASYRCRQTQPEPVAGRKANAARPRHGRRPVLTSPGPARLSKRR
jgi:CheY-like chemotaxis protein